MAYIYFMGAMTSLISRKILIIVSLELFFCSLYCFCFLCFPSPTFLLILHFVFNAEFSGSVFPLGVIFQPCEPEWGFVDITIGRCFSTQWDLFPGDIKLLPALEEENNTLEMLLEGVQYPKSIYNFCTLEFISNITDCYRFVCCTLPSTPCPPKKDHSLGLSVHLPFYIS